jgi:biopolymer transport protein ExbB
MKMLDFFYAIESFFTKGGPVLIVIFIVAFLMWSIILDKLFFHFFIYPKQHIQKDENRYINQKKFLHVKSFIQSGMVFIKIFIIISPLLGLLGTVSGMIEVFDVIAILGNSDPKAMSSGISQATIPTMVGMSVALSGIVFQTYLEQKNKKRLRLLAEKLHVDFKKGKK